MEMGCTNDCNPHDPNRPYNGLSRINFKYNQESFTEIPIEFAPYSVHKIKELTERAFERHCGNPTLYRHNFEGIGNFGPAADAGYPTDFTKIFNACCVTDFIIAVDFRRLNNSQLSGLNISRSDLSITLERATTAHAEDLHLDIYYVVGSERKVSAAANSVLV